MSACFHRQDPSRAGSSRGASSGVGDHLAESASTTVKHKNSPRSLDRCIILGWHCQARLSLSLNYCFVLSIIVLLSNVDA